MLTTALFGYHAIGYHLLAFILRLLSAILFTRIVDQLWPENKVFTYLSASIFLVYPGFLQQPIALIYNHHLSVFCLFLFSILLMIKNVKSNRPLDFTLLFSLIGSLHMFSIENFATLELVRPILIYLILAKKDDTRRIFKKTLNYWKPYLFVFLIFIIWRVFIFKFPTYQPGFIDHFLDEPVSALIQLGSRIPADFLTSTLGAWTDSLVIPTISSFGRSATLLFWLLSGSVFVLTMIFCQLIMKTAQTMKSSRKNIWVVFGIGMVTFFLAGSIVWILDLPLEIVFAWDRMTLAFIPATAVLLGLLLATLNKKTLLRNLIFSLIISSAIGSHFQNNMAYKRDWDNFKDFLWQLSWRMPTLEKNTTILGSKIGLRFFSDNSLTPALNLMYRTDGPSTRLDYLFYYTEVRLGLGLSDLEKDLPISQTHRSFNFIGSTSDMVALKYDPPACVQIMDRIYSNSITNPNLSDLQVGELRLTNLERIKLSPGHSPPDYLVGDQPEKSWCYYFQKADLARQFGQYDLVVELGNEAIEKGLMPRIGSEWLPFLEGYIRTGYWQKAEFLAAQIIISEGNFENGLCYTLIRIQNDLGQREKTNVEKLISDYNCR